MTIGLKISEPIATNLGNKSNTMIRLKNIFGNGKDGDGNPLISVSFDLYENRIKYDAGDAPLITAGFPQTRSLVGNSGIELSETTLHQALKSKLETEGLTITEETKT